MADDFNKIINDSGESIKKTEAELEKLTKENKDYTKESKKATDATKKYDKATEDATGEIKKQSEALDKQASTLGRVGKAFAVVGGAADSFGKKAIDAHQGFISGNFESAVGSFSKTFGAMVGVFVKAEDQLAKTSKQLRAINGIMGDVTFQARDMGKALGLSASAMEDPRKRAEGLQKALTTFGKELRIGLEESTGGLRQFAEAGISMTDAVEGMTEKADAGMAAMHGFRGALAISRATGLDLKDVVGDMAENFNRLGVPLDDSIRGMGAMAEVAAASGLSIKQLQPLVKGMTRDLEMFGVSGATLAKLPQMLGQFAKAAQSIGLGREIGMQIAQNAMAGLGKMGLGQRAFFGGAGGGRGGIGGVFEFEEQMEKDPAAMMKSVMGQIGGLIGGKLISNAEARAGGAGVQAQALAQRQMVGQQFGVGTDEARQIVDIMSQVKDGTLDAKAGSDKIKDIAKTEKEIAQSTLTVQEKMLAVQEDFLSSVAGEGTSQAVVGKLVDLGTQLGTFAGNNISVLTKILAAVGIISAGAGLLGGAMNMVDMFKGGKGAFGKIKGMFGGKGIGGGAKGILGKAMKGLGKAGKFGMKRIPLLGTLAAAAMPVMGEWGKGEDANKGFFGKAGGAMKRTFDPSSAKGKKNIGGTVGALAGGALGSLLGPLGTIGGAFAGEFIGEKIGGLFASTEEKAAEINDEMNELHKNIASGNMSEEEIKTAKEEMAQKQKDILELSQDRVSDLRDKLDKEKDNTKLAEELKEANKEVLKNTIALKDIRGQSAMEEKAQLRFNEMTKDMSAEDVEKNRDSLMKQAKIGVIEDERIGKSMASLESDKESLKYLKSKLKTSTGEEKRLIQDRIQALGRQTKNEKAKAEASKPKPKVEIEKLSEDVVERRARLRAAMGLTEKPAKKRFSTAHRIASAAVTKTREAEVAAETVDETARTAGTAEVGTTPATITPGDNVFNVTLEMDGKQLAHIMKKYNNKANKGIV